MDPLLHISVVIPALHEAGTINRLISHLRSLPSEAGPEIIVVDGDQEKSTIAAIVDQTVVAAVSTPGRAVQMNLGASLATGDVLLFLHADTMLPEQAFSLIRKALSDNNVVGGAFSLGIDSPKWYFRITEQYVALRTRLTAAPFGDQAIFLRRSYFRTIGGFRDIPIMEDVELMQRIRKNNGGIRIIPEKVRTSGRRWEKEGVFRGTCRNLLLQTLYCCGVHPRSLARFYR